MRNSHFTALVVGENHQAIMKQFDTNLKLDAPYVVYEFSKKDEYQKNKIASYEKIIAKLEEYKKALISNSVINGLDAKVETKESGINGIGMIVNKIWREMNWHVRMLLLMITTAGTIIQVRMSEIPVHGRITSGVKMMNVKDDVKVAKIAKVRERIEDADVSQTGDAQPEVNDVNTESEDGQDDQ